MPNADARRSFAPLERSSNPTVSRLASSQWLLDEQDAGVVLDYDDNHDDQDAHGMILSSNPTSVWIGYLAACVLAYLTEVQI